MRYPRIIRRALSITFVMIMSVSCGNQFVSSEGTQRFSETPIGLEGTPTPTSVQKLPDLTQTVPPTLSPGQIEQEISRFYFDNGGCELPCFLGIVPGQTTIQQIETRFSELGRFSDDTRPSEKLNNLVVTIIAFPAPPEIDSESWAFSIITKNDVVEGITVSSTYIKQTSIPTISNMLSIFGKPEELWIAVMPYMSGYDVDTAYEIALFYPTKGILIMGSGIAHILAEMERGVKVSICPHQIIETIDMVRHYPFTIHLWSPENKMSFTELNDLHLLGHPLYSLFNTFESSITSDEFYETYVNPSATQCFELTQ